MVDKEELIGKFKEGMALERGMTNSMNLTANKVRNAVVQQLLKGIALDSEKHHDAYLSLTELLSGVTALSEQDRDRIDAEIRNHIETERKMIDFVKELIDRVEDEKIKFMLKYIASDELRHHRTLNSIMNDIITKETISAEEWEEFLYEDAVAHGTPG